LPQYQINGDFTLHGMTRSITVVADADEKSEWTHLRGSFSILQSEYGITPFSKAFGTVGVADRLEIYGDFRIAN
jgi:polyisoprenoid-binding protein YceI